MRVTNSVIAANVSFNTQRAIARFLELQKQMSSGRRINKPSDDPIGTIRDLDYRKELSKIQQYRGAIAQGQNWMGVYDNALADINSMLSSARELAVAMADETFDEHARLASAREVSSMLERIIEIANDELEGKSIFAGFKTNIKPMIMSATGARYVGDTGNIQFQIGSSSRFDVNLIGSNVFLKQVTILGQTADYNTSITATTLLTDLKGGTGITMPPGTITISDYNLGINSIINLGAAIDINDVLNVINTRLTADGITNLTAELGAEGNNIKFVTTQNGLISNQTSLSVLNNGTGVSMIPGRFKVTDGAGIDFEVDISGDSTIADVINSFNTQVAAAGVSNVTMQVNAAGTGLEINDTNGVPLGLIIGEIGPESTTAANLGIVGSVGAQLIGQDLNPNVNFEIFDTVGTTAEELGILGKFNSDLIGDDLNPILLATANVTEFNNGLGFSLGEIIIKNGEMSRVIDLGDSLIVTVQDMLDAINNSGLNVTASINAAGSGIEIINNDPTRSLAIEEVSGGRTAKKLGLFGASDLIGTMMVLQNALENNDQEGSGLLLEHIDNALQHLLNQRATVGARGVRLESTDIRLINRDLSFTKLLSDVEDADLARLVIQLATYENNYQAALMASARIIQPTLLQFLR
ncbi:MAG: flagellar hook-associated protein FlgL [candidate division Zixibacteria bacterium]|nr:flagellar hook-associated protein FlgL [candidate division Zixibacteria bacterium]